MKLVAHLLQRPELLELPASTPVDYLPKDDRRFAIDREEMLSKEEAARLKNPGNHS